VFIGVRGASGAVRLASEQGVVGRGFAEGDRKCRAATGCRPRKVLNSPSFSELAEERQKRLICISANQPKVFYVNDS